MEEKLKRFRVRTIDGEMFISAKNIQEAIKLARDQIGALPNDVNLGIVKDLLNGSNDLVNLLQQLSTEIVSSTRQLDWDTVYEKLKLAASKAQDFASDIEHKTSSMLKLTNKE